METDRPLDALLPELRGAALPRTPVHGRVLEGPAEGGIEWVLLVFADPGSPQALHLQVRDLVEATLLAELSRTPESFRDQPARAFVGLRLHFFVDLEWDPTLALRAFGFQARTPGEGLTTERAKVVADEAKASGHAPTGEPRSTWFGPIRAHRGALGEKLLSIHEMMAARMGDDVWGRTPGGPSKLFAIYVQQLFGERLRPNTRGVDSLDLLVVQREPGFIRWMPPLVFQSVCDFLPIVAAAEHKAKVSWAESEDLGDGFMHPPLVRLEPLGGEAVHIPIGQHVLRWWMMPLLPGEDVPTLRAWLEDQVRVR